MVEVAAPVRRFTVAEYMRMAEHGIFQPDERVELVDGEILVVSQQKPRHSTALRLITKALERLFAEGYDVRTQMPLILGERSMPEPDLAVVSGSPEDYLHEHPRAALLVVEVSETTLATDRKKKLPVYARAGMKDYWIVNLVESVVEVYREPRHVSDKLGWSYKSEKRITAKGSVSPLAAPKSKILVASFLR